MYQKGDIEVWNDFQGYDARYDEYEEKAPHPYLNKKVIQLPHSFDSWVIGGELEARLMINDLEAAIKKLRA